MTLRLALVGDIHGAWDEDEAAWFDASDLHGVLFCGDLPRSRTHADLERIARRLARLRLPGLLIPGNHDATPPLAVLAEALGILRNRPRHVDALGEAVAALRAALGPVVLGGYSVHRFSGDGVDIDVVAARPHAMDSRHLTFAGHLQRTFGVTDLATSAAALRACVARCTAPVVFLAHNGPHGFGGDRGRPWALSRLGRDNGDRDLAEAVEAARADGHRVLAVLAGHMHHDGDGGRRVWRERRDGVLYVNAARVPRIVRRQGRRLHHHVRIETDGATLTATEVLVPRGAQMSPVG